MGKTLRITGCLALLCLLAPSTPAHAQRPGRPGPPPWVRATMAFGVFDANEDGALAEQEVPGPMWERLRAADIDGDGLVTLREVTASAATNVVDQFDGNEDGALAASEVPGPMWERLRAADANGDGQVTIAELSDALQNANRRPAQAGRGERPRGDRE